MMDAVILAVSVCPGCGFTVECECVPLDEWLETMLYYRNKELQNDSGKR